jgi:hypothetical protein
VHYTFTTMTLTVAYLTFLKLSSTISILRQFL